MEVKKLSPNWLIGAAVFLVFLISIRYVSMSVPFPDTGGFPEYALEKTASDNIIRFGFSETLGISDYSPSPRAEDHPYFYTHQVGFPALVLAGFRLSGLDIKGSRIALTGISLLGLLYLFPTLRLLGANTPVSLTIALLALLHFRATFLYLDHFTHAYYHLCFFGGTYHFLIAARERGRISRNQFWIVGVFLALSLLTSILCFTSLLITLLVLAKIEKKFVPTLKMAALITGIIVMAVLVRNGLVIGFETAFKDFFFTLSNRIIGTPSRMELDSFFKQNRIVLWGVEKIELKTLSWYVNLVVLMPLKVLGPILIAASLSFRSGAFFKVLRSRNFCLLAVICYGALSWHLLFPAQGLIYRWDFLEKFTLIPPAYLILMQISNLWRETAVSSRAEGAEKLSYKFTKFVILLGLLAFLVNSINRSIQPAEYLRAATVKSSIPQFEIPQESTVFSNIDGIVANMVIPNSLVFGSCAEQTLVNLTPPYSCPSSFMTKDINSSEPSHILISKKFIPGGQACVGSCLDSIIKILSEKHRILRSEGGFYLFETAN